MKENSQLTVAILDTLTNLNLKADLLAEVLLYAHSYTVGVEVHKDSKQKLQV